MYILSENNSLDKIYSIITWFDDPYTIEGRRRYREIRENTYKLVNHKWIKRLVKNKKQLMIIDYCSGCGVGGVALAKTLEEQYRLETMLTFIDLRRNALEKAEKFTMEELGYKPETIYRDVTSKIVFRKKYDIALLWGYTSSHFSPWDYLKLLINTYRSLKRHGVFILEESDRLYNILLKTGYKLVYPEISGDRISISLHKNYNPITGYIIQTAYNPLKNILVDKKTYFWSLAELLTLIWIFYQDIDMIPYQKTRGIIIARKPRKTIDPETYLEQKPTILETIKQM